MTAGTGGGAGIGGGVSGHLEVTRQGGEDEVDLATPPVDGGYGDEANLDAAGLRCILLPHAACLPSTVAAASTIAAAAAAEKRLGKALDCQSELARSMSLKTRQFNFLASFF